LSDDGNKSQKKEGKVELLGYDLVRERERM